MGACGCSDFDNVLWAVGVGENILAVSEYNGCNNGCDAPLGFTVHLMNPEGAATWDVKESGEWTPDKYGTSEQFLNLFSQGDLVEAAKEIESEINLEDYETLSDVLEDYALDLIRRAWARRRRHEQELSKRFGVAAPFGTKEGE